MLLLIPLRAAGTAALTNEPMRTTHELVISPWTNQPPADLPQHLRRGFELAHTYCQACHLFPEPQCLTKASWTNGVLRLMALRLGAARINYEKNPDGAILKEAGVYPNEPLLPREDWFAICEYFKETAPEEPLPQAPHPPIRSGLKQFQVKRINTRAAEPWTTLVKINPAQKRLYLGDAGARSLDILDAGGRLLNSVSVDSGPVSMTFREGGAYLTLIGKIFPSDQLAGRLVFVHETNGAYTVRTIFDKLRRPTDTAFADLNGDGKEDMIISEYGNILGQFSWYENLGGNRFEQHVLFERPGSILAWVYDINKDHLPDIFVQTAQAREGVYLYQNEGGGVFSSTAIAEYPPFWGSCHFELVDFNLDGFVDLLVANGDSGDYISATKNFHGLRLYLNDGRNNFKETWFYPLNGAYKAVAADFDRDGDLDIAAISFYPDYLHSPEESFVYLENKGGMNFDAYTIAEHSQGRWLTMDVGDLDGDGDPDIVLGSFANGPPSIPIPTSIRAAWQTNAVTALLLENRNR